ncbi:cullin, a subunit of E3 ubiquitin ligase [Mycolicibacterium aurum]|uniref:Cullin, a subunit of E3 ubiquitin ligase n=1 Tax=Mycolicibacterium aurum TaxID=1791 RepID=A0A448IHG1_MYCAU|nr:cullin, a subunit of E3 ubiquitin ligase [Mycolicibacterium aurum]
MVEGVFLGSAAVACGVLTRHELRTFHRKVLPDVYVANGRQLTLRDRATAAWLWSGRNGVVSGVAASALHGARWVDDDVVVELNWPNHRSPVGVRTRNDTLHGDEVMVVRGLPVTTPERTAFDLARRGAIGDAVARLDALVRATQVKADDVLELARRHPHVRGLRRVSHVLDLVDAGAQSPRETWLRMMLVADGYPRPQTQIPVYGADGYPRYYLDMGWEHISVAVEYDGEHHRENSVQYRGDILRMEYIASAGWLVVRVVKGQDRRQILTRVERAVAARGGFRDCVPGEPYSHVVAASAASA